MLTKPERLFHRWDCMNMSSKIKEKIHTKAKKLKELYLTI
jgi:hypothetical protein